MPSAASLCESAGACRRTVSGMARPTLPLAPRISRPDLPDELTPGTFARGVDLHGALVEAVTGVVDAAHSYLSESRVSGVEAQSLDLTGASLTDVEFDDVRAVLLDARQSRWQSIRMAGGRIATLDLSRSDVAGVEFRGLRIDYLTLAGTTASDLLFVDCTIGTLDAPQARLSRVGFQGCRADEVDNRDWRVENVDLRGLEALHYLDIAALRGTTLAERQVTSLAHEFARAAGVDIRD